MEKILNKIKILKRYFEDYSLSLHNMQKEQSDDFAREIKFLIDDIYNDLKK